MRRTTWFALLALALALPALAATDVYRWKDAKGVVHFADAPPPNGVSYKIVNLSTGTERDPAPPAPAATTPAPDAQATADKKKMQDTPENRARLCSILKERIELLAGDQPLTMAADSTKPMAADERTKELNSSLAQQKEYCSK